MLYKEKIQLLSNIKSYSDMVNFVIKDIKSNKIVLKEIEKSTISMEHITDYIIASLKVNTYDINHIKFWFKKLKTTESQPNWPKGIDKVYEILSSLNAVIMDVYTVTRMFKVFNVKESESYPKEPRNIIYYAGDGHTVKISIFLKMLGFKRTENYKTDVKSCVSMEKTKQPLFS